MRYALAFLFLSNLAAAEAVPDFNIYPACSIAMSHSVACVPKMTQNVNHVASVNAELSDPSPLAGPWQGDTVATVNAQFPAVMVWKFEILAAPALNAQFELLGQIQLARFSHAYYLATHGETASLTAIAKAKLTPANFAKWESAFNPAVAAPIPQSLAAHVKAGETADTLNGLETGVPVPNVNMTFQEIYDEYLFTVAETEAEALFSTAIFAGGRLWAAGAIGYKIGSEWYAFASWVDPNYGYDLVTMYGEYANDFGPIDGGFTYEVTFGPISTVWSVWMDQWVFTQYEF